eukprot:1809163-Karenia_brevis.AAC.1
MGSLTRVFSAGSAVNCPCNDPTCQSEEDVMDIGMLSAEEEQEEDVVWVWDSKNYNAMLKRVEGKIVEVYRGLEMAKTDEDIAKGE